MNASIGDRVAVKQLGTPDARNAVVIDLRDSGSDRPTYLVEWEDNGHRQLVEFGPGSEVKKH